MKTFAGLCIALFLCASFSLEGCSPKNDTPEIQFVMGVSLANLEEPWRVVMAREIENQAALHPNIKLILEDSADNPKKQIADVQNLLNYEADILIISPVQAEDLTPIIASAYKKIPVIVLDRSVVGYDYTLYIGPNNTQIGARAGDYVADLLKENGGQVVEIQGRINSPPALDRNLGFQEAVRKNPRVIVSNILYADWLSDTAEDRFAAYLRSNPKIDVVFAHNDAMAYGAWKAAQQIGYKDLKIIGVDGLKGSGNGLDLISRNILSATFVCPTGGREAVEYGMDILNHVPGLPKKVFLSNHRVTAEYNLKMIYTPSAKVNKPKETVLGYVQVGHESSWRLANTLSIKQAAQAAGVNLIFRDCDQQQKKQIEAIDEFIRRKVDVIALSPIIESGWEEILTKAKKAGIPVILSDREVNLKDDTLWTSYMGSDFTEEGRRAARWLIQAAWNRSSLRVLEIQGTQDSAPTVGRRDGFREILVSHPQVKITDSLMGEFTFDSGYKLMKTWLGTHDGSRIDALFCHNDDMALGAIKALKEAGFHPGSKILTVSIDGVKEAFDAMKRGDLNCSVECNPLLGPLLMKQVMDYSQGKELPSRIITSEEVFPAITSVQRASTRVY